MSDVPNNTQKDSGIDEEQAYTELCQIIAFALKTLDMEALEFNIAAWKRKYPIEKFTSEYKTKIKNLLNSNYLSVLQNYFALMAKEFAELNQSKAYSELCRIVANSKKTGDLKKVQCKIDTWKSKYPTNKFSSFYLDKIERLTNEKKLAKLVEKFDQEDALKELKQIIDDDKSKQDPDTLKSDVENWKRQYPIQDFQTDKFKSEAESLTKDDYLANAIIIEVADSIEVPEVPEPPEGENVLDVPSNFNAQKEYFELENILKNTNSTSQVFEWTYRNRNHITEFGDTLTGMILAKTARYYSIPKYGTYSIPKVNSDAADTLTVGDTQTIDETRKNTVEQFFAILSTGRALLPDEKQNFEAIHKKSAKVEEFKDTLADIDLVCEFDYQPEPEKGEIIEPLFLEAPEKNY